MSGASRREGRIAAAVPMRRSTAVPGSGKMLRVTAPEVDYPAQPATVLAAFQAGGTAAAAEALPPIAYRPEPIPPRRSLPPAAEIRVFRRDRWTCRYCGRRTVFLPVMALLGQRFPDQCPYHPHWKAGLTHPACTSRCSGRRPASPTACDPGAPSSAGVPAPSGV